MARFQPLPSAVFAHQPAALRRFEELLLVLGARDEASDGEAPQAAGLEADASETRLDALVADDALATFVGELLLTHGRALRDPNARDPAGVSYEPRLFVVLLGALAKAKAPAALSSLDRCIDELIEDRELLMLATLLHAPRDAVRARVAEHFRSYRGSAAMAWADELGLGLPAEWDWKVALRFGTVSKRDRGARHKRSISHELRCAIHHPPFHLRHAVMPTIIAWSIDLTGPEPWSGSWLDTEPEAPLVDASHRMRPVKHMMKASIASLPELVTTVGELMGTPFCLDEAIVSVHLGYSVAPGLPERTLIEGKIRSWLGSNRIE